MNFKRLAIASLFMIVLSTSSLLPVHSHNGMDCYGNISVSKFYSFTTYVLYLGGKKAYEILKEKAVEYLPYIHRFITQ